MILIEAIEFLQKIQKGEIKLDLCRGTNTVTSAGELKVAPKDSASPSLTLMGSLAVGALGKNRMPVIAKLFRQDNKDKDIGGLLYEISVYKYIIDNIIAKNESPNFVAYLGASCCDEGLFSDTSGLAFLTRKYCVLFTERAGNGAYFGYDQIFPVATLSSVYEELLSDLPRSKTEIQNIFFQIFYSLELMQRYRLVHNDLHSNNVLVAILPKEIALGFQIGQKKYQIKTRYIPYMFDWDAAFCEKLGDNPKITQKAYGKLGIFNGFNKKADLYTLLCTLEGIDYSGIIEAQEENYFSRYGEYRNPAYEYSKAAKIPAMGEKEKKTPYVLSIDQYNKINKYRPLYKEKPTMYISQIKFYKFGKGQIDEIFEGKVDDFKNLSSVILKVYVANRKPYFEINNPFPCRITSISPDFPTPLELIETKMADFIVPSFQGIPDKYIYKMPERIPETRIFINPITRAHGRKELEKLGIRPRFPKQKSGYVKIRTKKEISDFPDALSALEEELAKLGLKKRSKNKDDLEEKKED